MILVVIFGWPDKDGMDPLHALAAAVAVIWLVCIAYPLAILTLLLLLVRQLASLPRQLVQNRPITRR